MFKNVGDCIYWFRVQVEMTIQYHFPLIAPPHKEGYIGVLREMEENVEMTI